VRGLCAGAEGYSTEEDQELLSRIEKQLKRRFVIGSQVSEHAIVQDFTRQVTLHLHDYVYSCLTRGGPGQSPISFHFPTSQVPTFYCTFSIFDFPFLLASSIFLLFRRFPFYQNSPAPFPDLMS